MTSNNQARWLKDLDLLVSAGLDVAPVAPALCSLLVNIMGAEAGGMCWFSKNGLPEGFYQQGSSREAEELFMNHYEELFVGPHEYTPFWSVRNKKWGIGKSWMAGKEYLRSNTFNLLIEPSHFHYLLDVVIDVADVPQLTACFFRPVQNPFTQTDAKKLTSLIPMLRRAIGKHANPLLIQSTKTEGGYLLISQDGALVEMIDTPAEQLLSTLRLFNQNVSAVRRLSEPPKFIQLLCKQLRLNGGGSATAEIPTAGGAIVVVAKWLTPASREMSLVQANEALPRSLPKKILVAVQFKPAGAIEIVRGVGAMGLSPLQGRIALYAAAGGSRTDCALQHRVSKEALKKHLREIYAASHSNDWQELCSNLRAGL